MEENNKYYTPKITDLKVGYICESTTMPSSWSIEDCNDVDNSDDIWGLEPITWGRLCRIIEYSEETEGGIQRFIRTPYLSKEDIEKEGWIFKIEYGDVQYFELGDIWKDNGEGKMIEYRPITHVLKIISTDIGYNQDGPNYSIKFHGKCLSINEFKYVTKELLGIE